MSGPTGISGFQGRTGDVGTAGVTGMTGPYGRQGADGPAGTTGPTGLPGATGTRLYGNGSLIQNAKPTTCPTAVLYTRVPITFTTFNPGLSGDKSVSISGQYDSNNTNYYSAPLRFNGSNITIPAGKYHITASMNVASGVDSGGTVQIELVENGNVLASSIPAQGKGTCHLQCVYSPTINTVVSITVLATDFVPSGSIGTGATLSIVKIW